MIHHLLAHHVFNDDVPHGLVAGLQNGLEGHDGPGIATLHVAATSAPDAFFGDFAAPGSSVVPILQGAGRHHVHVSVENERLTPAVALADSHQVGAALFLLPHVGGQAGVLHHGPQELINRSFPA